MLLIRRPPLLASLVLTGSLVTLAAAQVADIQILVEPGPPGPVAGEPPAAEPTTHPIWQPRVPATQPVAEATLQQWFNDLAAADAAVRDRAVSALLDLTRADLPTLKSVVEQSRPIAPSQVGALRDVVTHVFLTGETYPCEPKIAFLGVYQPVLESVDVARPDGAERVERVDADGDAVVTELGRASTGVPIESRIPGFCAFRSLRDGDVVLGVIDPAPRRMRDWRELTLAIQAFPAAQTITLEVLRQGTVQRIPVTLDAKPLGRQDEWVGVILPARERAAEAYWNQHFAPLMQEQLSAAQ